jgi:hypothetical protein
MGYNTSVIILNDALGQLKEDREFRPRLADGISKLSIRRPQDVRIGQHVNACHVLETHHADQMLPILVGGNFGRVIESTYVRWSSEEMELDLLQQLAKKHGYTLRRTKKP